MQDEGGQGRGSMKCWEGDQEKGSGEDVEKGVWVRQGRLYVQGISRFLGRR